MTNCRCWGGGRWREYFLEEASKLGPEMKRRGYAGEEVKEGGIPGKEVVKTKAYGGPKKGVQSGP